MSKKAKSEHRGGKRSGSGRKPKYGRPLSRPTTIRLPAQDLEFLRSVDPNLSTAVHKLVEQKQEQP